MHKRLLFVDDEASILKSLTRGFLYTDYEIVTAESALSALRILETENIDLILSDMRMPNMDGYQLLSYVKDKYPKILRIILSGFTDEDLIFKAIQQNIAKHYLLKPWENERMIKIIDQLFETDELLQKSSLSLLVNNLTGLPTIPSSYQRIMHLIDHDADIPKIASEIEKDQSIASKVLHVANSAFYNLKTGSIRHAVTYLGLQNMRNILFSTSVLDLFQCSGSAAKTIERLWNHAYLTNRILGIIYDKCLKAKLPDSGQASGLLHNIGMVFFLKYFPKTYIPMLNESGSQKTENLENELKAFGATHQEAGGYLMKWWDLPYPIIEAALYHHEPSNESVINRELVSAVHIAEKHAWELINHTKVPLKIDNSVYAIFNTDEENFEELLKTLDI